MKVEIFALFLIVGKSVQYFIIKSDVGSGFVMDALHYTQEAPFYF